MIFDSSKNTGLKPKTNWAGEFRDSHLEMAFNDAEGERTRSSARLCVMAFTSASAIFLPLDFVLLPNPTDFVFATIRVLIIALGVFCFTELAKAESHKSIVRISYIHAIFFFSLNALIFNHPSLVRHGGVLMPLIAIAMPMYIPGRGVSAAIVTAYGALVSLFFWGLLRPDPESWEDLGIILLMTTVAFVCGNAFRIQLNRMRRDEFLHIERARETNRQLTVAKEQAEAGERIKGEFLAVMSHEIRTPMNGILGMIHLLLSEHMRPSVRERLEIVRRSAESLRIILDDVLDLSSLERGNHSLEFAPVDFARLVADAVNLMAPRAREKDVTLEYIQADNTIAWVRADAARLRQVLLNLIGNAVKFTEQGTVKVVLDSTERTSGATSHQAVRVSVTDTGIGIAADEMSRLFQPFAQADGSIRRRFGGSGLGLAITKRLIDAMGGEISVESAIGQGSCFTVVLPLEHMAVPSKPDVVEPSVPAYPVSEARALRLLVVEDNPVNQKVAQGLLTLRGHVCEIAENGLKAVELVQKHDFDAVLMDLQMPEMDGYEATRRIRQLGGPYQVLPIIALTANAMREDIARSRESGMDAHLSKPIKVDQLVEVLASISNKTPLMPTFAIDPGADTLVIGALSSEYMMGLRRMDLRLFPCGSLAPACAMLEVRRFPLILLADAAVESVRQLRASAGYNSMIVAFIREEKSADADILSAGSDLVLSKASEPEELRKRLFPNLEADEAQLDLLDADSRAKVRSLFYQHLCQQLLKLEEPNLTAEDAKAIAHRILGSASTLGFNDLAQVARRILTAEDNNTIQLLTILNESIRYAIHRLEADPA